MKKKIAYIITLAVVSTAAFLFGKSQTEITTETVEVVPEGYINMQSDEFFNNYIDMREVTDFEATETGLCIYLENGDGYYWER